MNRENAFGFAKKGFLALVGVSFASLAQATDRYVDDDNYHADYKTYQEYVAAGFDGSTKEKAFGTIQMAIDAANENDVIKICPGVYTNGTTETVSVSHSTYNFKQKARVYVTKKLTLESTSGKAKTIIRGARGTISSNGSNSGYYVDGVTCIVVADAAAGSVFRDLTIENGWPHQSAFRSAYGAGGITKANWTDESDFLAVGCTFDTCYGRGAGAIVCGTAVRCFFTGCGSTWGGSVTYMSKLYNCLFSRNGMLEHGAYGDLYDSVAVNCTLVNNVKDATGVRGATRLYNCVNYSHLGTTKSETATVASNCVSEVELSAESYNLTKIAHSNIDQMTNVCLCPVIDDVRPVKGGVLDGHGDRSYIAQFPWIPADEITKDFNGNAFSSEADFPIGVVLPAAAVKSGVFVAAVWDNYPYNLDGYEQIPPRVYYQRSEWPSVVRLKPGSRINKGKPLVYMEIANTLFYPGRYDHIVQMMPKAGTVLQASSYEVAKYEYYVGGDNANDENAGTADAPFATIQRAIDQNVADYKRENGTWGRPTIVHVRPGTYGAATGTYANEPGDMDTASVNYGIRSSINVPLQLNVHVVADEGPSVTFIEGAPDPETKGAGPNATRCLGVQSTAHCAFSGFTFRRGYAFSNDGADSSNKSLSPLVGVGGEGQHFYDCVFTEAFGYVPCRGGWYHRCLFTGLTNCHAGVAYQMTLSSCILANNDKSMSYALYNDVKAFNCSVYETESKTTIQNRNGTIVNCAYDVNGTMINFQDAGFTIAGSVIKAKTQASQSHYGDGFAKEDPYFVNPKAGDFRINLPSSAKGKGVLTDPYGKYSELEMLRYVRADFYNRPLIDAEGGIYAGAVADTAQVGPVYVSPDGSDANDGRTSETPLKTLQAAVSCYRPANDGGKVIAKAGVYDEGSAVHVGWSHTQGLRQPTVRSRVVVPAGITLESEEGPEKTFIVGAPDSAVNKYGLGLGPDAIRCAFVENNAVLKGFTLTGGHTDWYDAARYPGEDQSYQDNFWGAGAMGRSYTTNPSIVENCIVSNNFADLGGAGGYVAFYGCRVTHNVGYRYGGFFRMGSAYNCYVEDCRGPRVCDVISACVNCTFGAKCWNYASDSPTHVFANVSGGAKIWNLLLCDDLVSGVDLGASSDIRGLVAAKGFKPMDASAAGSTWTGPILTNEYTITEMRGLYDHGVPLSRTAPTVDAGYASAYELLRGTRVDAGQNQRIYNAALDIGAYEFDWRGDFAKALRKKGVEVLAASEMVSLDDEAGLDVPPDGSLTMRLTAPATGKASFVVEPASAVVKAGETELLPTGNVYSLDLAAGVPVDVSVTASGVCVNVSEVDLPRRGLTVIVR